MKIGIDCRALTGSWRFRGIANYTNNLIRAIEELGYSPVLYAWPCEDFDKNHKIELFGSTNYAIWENINLPIRLIEDGIDLVILPLNTGPVFYNYSKKLIIIHDLIAFDEKIKFRYSNLYKRWNLKLQNKKQKFIFVSETVRSEFKDLFKCRNDTNILHNVFTPIKQLFFNRNNNKYIFSISGTSETKNLSKLIDSYLIYLDRGGELDLYILGVDDVTRQKYEQVIGPMKNKIKFLSTGISSKYLHELYQNSSLFVFISTQEGFGIPLLEAVQYKVPIVRSNIKVFNEILNSTKYVCSPYDSSEIANNIALAEKEKFIISDIDMSFLFKKYSFPNYKNKLKKILNE